AEQQERRCPKHEDGHRLRASPPLEKKLFSQRRNHRARPASRVMVRLAKRPTRSTWCVAIKTDASRLRSSATTSSTKPNPSGSSCPYGSSRNAMDGCCKSTRANDSRLRMPAEKVETGSSARAERPTRSSTTAGEGAGAPQKRETTSRFSRAVSDSYRYD